MNTSSKSIVLAATQGLDILQDMTPVKNLKTGWEAAATKVGRIGWRDKNDPNTWTQVDIQWYVKNMYHDKYGLTLHIPICAAHQQIKTIKFAMEKRLGREPSHLFLKQYIDFVFERYVDDIIRQDGQFSFYKLTKAKLIMDFLDRFSMVQDTSSVPKENVSVETISAVEPLSMENLTAAYRINPQYMVTNYGILVTINYLILAKKKTVDEAVVYVQSAMTKISTKGSQETTAVINATNQYQPYPKWLPFVDVAKVVKMTVAISDDNEVFAALRAS